MFISYFSFSQSKKEADFVTACKGVIKAFYKKDINAINKLIHPKYGLYIISNPYCGAMAIFTNEKKIGKKHELANIELERPDFRKTPLQLGKFPDYKIDGNGAAVWEKSGFFATHSITDTPLVTLAGFWIDNGDTSKQKYYKVQLPIVKYIEATGRSVLYTPEDSWDIGFWMSYIDKKWYLTIYDDTEPG